MPCTLQEVLTADVDSRVRAAWIARHAQKHVDQQRSMCLWLMVTEPAVPINRNGGAAAPFAQT
jgi:hypothetical protein